MTRFLLLLGALLGVACQPDLTEPWRLTRPRIMVGRVETQGDPARPRPRPGELFDVRFMMGLPGQPQPDVTTPLDAKLELCLGVLLTDGTLACGAPDGAPPSLPLGSPAMVVSDDEVRINDLPVPNELANLPPPFDEIDRIVLFGAVCVGGRVERVAGKVVNEDPSSELFRCIDNENASFKEPLAFTLSVFLELAADDANSQPSFACAEDAPDTDACKAGVKVDGENLMAGDFVLVRPKRGSADRATEILAAWPADADLPWADCAMSDLPQVRTGDDEYSVRVRFDGADREDYTYEMEEYGKPVRKEAREELLVSHGITEKSGDLARYFSVLESQVPDDEAEIEFTYTPPEADSDDAKDLGPEGRLVRIYFGLRDERGGVDYTTRELCLLPRAGG